jgi:nitrate/nitrite transporter NarK
MIALQGCCVGIANGALFMVSSWAWSPWNQYLTTSSTRCCNLQTVYPLPSQFFMRKRGLATGITSCGGGIGGAVWSVIIDKLIHKVGLPWTYRVMGEWDKALEMVS